MLRLYNSSGISNSPVHGAFGTGFDSDTMSRQHLHDLQQTLPAGASLLIIDDDGTLLTVRRDGVQPLDPAQDDDLLPFIDQGHFARYLIGNATTSDTNPTNATYKLGIVAAHRGFTPHAHGAEHFVFSSLVLVMPHAACTTPNVTLL